MNRIEEFYLGQNTDGCGRTIEEIWAWDDEALESVHDYIQWLFPSKRPSDFNPDAPVLTDAVIDGFHASPELRDRLVKSFRRMLQFYGFRAIQRGDAVIIERGLNWRERFPVWLSAGDHNHLRITRILACLRTLGLSEYALAFVRALGEVRQEFPDAITSRTSEFWHSAVG
jgi:hypothetical protein